MGGSAATRGPLLDSREGISRLRITPWGLVSGAPAIALCEAGDAIALAGGPFAFTHAQLSGPEAPTDGTGDPAMSARQLRRWAARALDTGDDVPAALIARVSKPRPDIAGLAVSGAGARPRIMGVCNVTPDSFSDGGAHATPDRAVAFGRALHVAGADIIDVGGESTRPGAESVDPDTELARVLPVISELASHGIPVSVDTRRAQVMSAAIAAGATMFNDVSGLSDDPDSMSVVAAADMPVILMHMQGQPSDMQFDPQYGVVLDDVYDALAARVDACIAAGVASERIVVDPGFGFGKTVAHNYELLAGLARFHGLGCPVAVGLSRKSFIGTVTGEEDPAKRVSGSVSAVLLAVDRGAQFIRVHDVAETRQALDVWRAAL